MEVNHAEMSKRIIRKLTPNSGIRCREIDDDEHWFTDQERDEIREIVREEILRYVEQTGCEQKLQQKPEINDIDFKEFSPKMSFAD